MNGEPASLAADQAGGRFVRWLLRWADHPAGTAVLVVLALLEATVFPAPTEALLVALAVARPRRGWWFGAIATAASVSGGLLAYHMGATLFDEVARPVLARAGLLAQVPALASAYRHNAMLALATSGYTPIPYMLYTAMAGAFGVPLPVFVVGSLVGRGLKYLPIAVLAAALGPTVQRLVARYATWVVLAVLVALAVWLLVRA